jgi:hypothetical protein
LKSDELAKIWEKWSRWLNGRLFQEVGGLYSDRMVARRVAEVASANPHLAQGNYLLNWMLRNYERQACVSVQKLLDKRKDCISLRQLALELLDECEAITRADYVDSWLGASTGALTRQEHLIAVKSLDGTTREIDIGDEVQELNKQWVLERANAQFDVFADPGAAHVSPLLIKFRLDAAVQAARKVQIAVNKHIRHQDQEEPPLDLTHGCTASL